MNVVRHHGAAARELEALIDREVIRGPGKVAAHLFDLRGILIDMSLETQSGMFTQERDWTNLEHRFRRGERAKRGVTA